MEVEAFLLCDCATDSQGKLNVLGAFDTIFATRTPIAYPACTVAARIRFSRIEQGEHNIRINVIDEDGKEISPRLERTISIQVAENDNSSFANIILNFQGLKLKRYGEYRVDLAIDGRQEATVPLKVRQPPDPA
ncbi:MAG: DUF6941 family protein [Planctomycetota bacterium]|jgi:hypothetical protein